MRVEMHDVSVCKLTLDGRWQGVSGEYVVPHEVGGDQVVGGSTVDEGNGRTAGESDVQE